MALSGTIACPAPAVTGRGIDVTIVSIERNLGCYKYAVPDTTQVDHAASQTALLREFDRGGAVLASLGEGLTRDLRGWLSAESGLKVHSVTARVKSRGSLAAKLGRPDKSYARLWDVTDLLGLRIVAYFEDEVDCIARILERELPVALEHSIDRRRRQDASAFGYRSVHYVCRIGARALAPVPPEACFEVQVRTVLEHAWAEIEHDLGYKAHDAIPAEARRRLSRLAGMLELADQEFVAIRTGLEGYARSLPSRIESGSDPVPLDLVSFPPLLECTEVRDVDASVASALGMSLGTEPFYPLYLIRMLSMTGVRTVHEAREGLREHEATIGQLVAPYFAFATRAWGLSPDAMPTLLRGYSLFFLAHARVLTSSALRLDKVARLADLYRELDYPHDARAAQQVAGMLVDAFGSVV